MVDSSPFAWRTALCKSGPPVYVRRIHPNHENYVIKKHYRACVLTIFIEQLQHCSKQFKTKGGMKLHVQSQHIQTLKSPDKEQSINEIIKVSGRLSFGCCLIQ